MKGIYHEDELWVPSVFMTAATIRFMNKGFYGYRLNRKGSIVSKPNIKRLFDKLIVAEILEGFKDNGAECNRIVAARQASLILGVILDLPKYKDNERYDELCRIISGHRRWLNYGKYRGIWMLSHLLGLRVLSAALKVIV